MHVIMFVGFALFLSTDTTSAASLEPLLQAAGLIAASKLTSAPDFRLPDTTGRMHRLHDQRGKVVFLNFWATWCPPCRHEMPLMEQLYQALRQQALVMWAVNLRESQEHVAHFMSTHRLHFPALLDADGAVSALYTLRGLPTTYLIDCVGNTVGWAVGAREWTNDATRTLLAVMLNDATCRR